MPKKLTCGQTAIGGFILASGIGGCALSKDGQGQTGFVTGVGAGTAAVAVGANMVRERRNANTIRQNEEKRIADDHKASLQGRRNPNNTDTRDR